MNTQHLLDRLGKAYCCAVWSQFRLLYFLPSAMCIGVLCLDTEPAPSVGIEQPIAC